MAGALTGVAASGGPSSIASRQPQVGGFEQAFGNMLTQTPAGQFFETGQLQTGGGGQARQLGQSASGQLFGDQGISAVSTPFGVSPGGNFGHARSGGLDAITALLAGAQQNTSRLNGGVK